MKKQFIVVFVFFNSILPAQSEIIFSEIMFKPQSGNNEFIELYNLSSSDSIDLSGYKIKYYTSNEDEIISAGNGTVLPPLSFAVIFEGDYELLTGIYKDIVPRDALILKISDNSFGSTGMSNSSGRQVLLFNSAGDTADSHIYSANNPTGFSDEKIILNNDSSESNWNNSVISNGTPGYANSVTPKLYDLQITNFYPLNNYSLPGELQYFNVTISNQGANTVDNFSIEIYQDKNLDSITTLDEKILTLAGAKTNPGDTINLNFEISNLDTGTNYLIAKLLTSQDEDTSNNISYTTLSVININEIRNDIVINEIMYAPESSQPEWFELYNRSNKTIDLKKYRTADKSDTTTIQSESFLFLPGEYLIISADSSINNFYDITSKQIISSFPTQNNSGDKLILLDSLSRTIDSLEYSPVWGGTNGKSLERISVEGASNDPFNWKTSVNSIGATPGFKNSVTSKDYDLEISQFNIENNYGVIGEEQNFNLVIKNSGKLNTQSFDLEIFHDLNADSITSAAEQIYFQSFQSITPGDSIKVNYKYSGFKTGVNYFIAKISTNLDEDSTNNTSYTNFVVVNINEIRNDIVINEIMYAPESSQPEWFELYNRSNKTIDLKKYRTADKSDTTTIQSESFLFLPGEYLIISADSSINNFYDITSKQIISSFPTQNNTGDKLILLDSLSRTIDSLEYSPVWGGTNGKSLERISVEEASNDPFNWKTSVNSTGATPGFKNSVTFKDYDLEISQFNIENNYGVIGREQNFNLIIKNSGKLNTQSFDLEIFHDLNADSITSAAEQIYFQSYQSITPGDSIKVNYKYSGFKTGVNYFIAKVSTNLDEDSTNNTSYTNFVVVTIIEIRNDIVINEIMYAPESSQPEWFELYNRSNKTIDLKNYQVADKSDTTTIQSESFLFLPGEYLIISADSSINNFYDITSKQIISSFPTQNNTGDKLILLDSLNRTIDSLEYSPVWGGTNGKSLERISVEEASNDPFNWKTSVNSIGATPGFKNSVTPKEYDLGIIEFSAIKKIGILNEPAQLKLVITNPGKLKTDSFSIDIFNDFNQDSISQTGEKIADLNESPLNSGDTAAFSFDASNLLEGKNILTARIDYPSDEDTTNNYATVVYYSVNTSLFRNDIVINEIMYDPKPQEPEWIELFNNSSNIINLQNFQLADNGDTAKIIFGPLLFLPNEFLILSADSSLLNIYDITSKFVVAKFPTLNNSRDKIILIDSLNRVIDSLEYFDDWGGTKGFSLERISTGETSYDKTNWRTSVSNFGSTPGKINSISKKYFDIYLADLIFNPAAPLINDEVNISVLLKNIGKSDAAFSVLLFEDTNKDSIADLLLDNISNITIVSGDSVIVNFNYAIPELTKERFFIAEINFPADQDSNNNFMSKNIKPGYESASIVINEIMYDPGKNQPEWIELFNNSNDTINLKNWEIVNLLPEPTRKTLTKNNLSFEPGKYLVIASDSSFLNSYNFLSSKVIITALGLLSNTTDGVAIYDFRNTTIDSIIYNSTWGGKNGFSIERISVSGDSNDSTNWRSSLSINKSTAGAVNSVVNLISYKRSSLVINEIMFDPATDNSEFIELQNISGDSINIGGWKIIDGDSRQSIISNVNFYLQAGQYYVITNDSIVSKVYSLKNNFIVPDDKLSLSNSGELLIIKDVSGNIIDSLIYSADWHNSNFITTKNRSLERINPFIQSSRSNWNSSVSSAGATPGKENSIFTKSIEPASKISISPNPFSPDNDGYEDFTIINYSLSQPVAQIRAEIFDSKGRHIRTLQTNYASGSKGSLIFDGLDDEHRPLRIGIYILLFEAVNANNGVLEQFKKAFVIARKL